MKDSIENRAEQERNFVQPIGLAKKSFLKSHFLKLPQLSALLCG